MAKNQMNLTIPEKETSKWNSHVKWLKGRLEINKKSEAIREGIYILGKILEKGDDITKQNSKTKQIAEKIEIINKNLDLLKKKKDVQPSTIKMLEEQKEKFIYFFLHFRK